MIRRGGPGGWGDRPGGVLYPSGRGGSPARSLILGAILLGVVLVAGYLIFRACSGNACKTEYCSSSAEIATPAGYTRVSKIYEWKAKRGVEPGEVITVAVPLERTTADGRNLSFFQYGEQTKAWEPVASAILDQGGKSVSARFNTNPLVIAVLRRESAAGHVIAYSAHNAVLNHEAAQRITILHTRDFRPSSDGGVLGEVTDLKISGIPTGAPVAHIPSITVDDRSQLPVISGVLSNPTTRTAHVQQIVKKVNDLNLAGIDVAYTILTVTERTGFSLFIAELGQALQAQKKTLTVTLPPPIRLQDRIDEGGYDWATIGRVADIVQMGVYRDQSTYRRDMPEILKQLSLKMSPSKLVLTVSPYATEKSTEGGLRALSLAEAMTTATKLTLLLPSAQKLTVNTNVDVVAGNINKADGRSGVVWDSQVAAVAFAFEENGGRTIWIENLFSVGFKLEFIPRFGLGGVAVEDATADLLQANIWPAIVPFITSGQPLLFQPNSNDLVPRWRVSPEGKAGQIEGGQQGKVRWSTPPAAGTYQITITVSDGVALFESELSVNVLAKDSS